MISKTFIERPILSTVLAIIILLAGAVTMGVLPIEQNPNIVPPTIQVACSYPGANAQTVAETVGVPIEEQVNGVDDMIYMSSVSASDGSYNLTVTFDVGVDPDMSNVLVQNRVSIAEPTLPSEVKNIGITTRKKSTNMVMIVAIKGEGITSDSLYLSNFATLNVVDEISRLAGVGDVNVFGVGDYSMRIWLDPTKMHIRGLTPDDIVSSLKEQNIQVAAGQIGAMPSPVNQQFEYTLTTLGRLKTVEEFENVIIKVKEGAKILRLKDVARIELGSESYTIASYLRDQPNAALGIYQLPGANALDISTAVNKKMEELAQTFPEGVSYEIILDNTDFVVASINEVKNTLFIAVFLVLLVIWLFLQDWRATIIPAITIPVSLIGTFAVMAALGFTINMLTLFGLILAIGIVVDDAIVVVENVSRHLEEGMTDRVAATKLAMKEVQGPVIATTLVLLSVFVPSAFMGGITGLMFKQFALTISAATLISSINALTLSPAMCALFLRPPKESNFFLFKAFNKYFQKTESGFTWIIRGFVRKSGIMMVVFIVIIVMTVFGFMKIPTSFIPNEDQGYFMVNIQLPDGATLPRTNAVVKELNNYYEKVPGLKNYLNVVGFSILDGTSSSNSATSFVMMENWNERKADSMIVNYIVSDLNKQFSANIEEANVFCFSPPAIQGLGSSGGFSLMLQDRGSGSYDQLQNISQEVVEKGNAQSALLGVNTTFRANVPQYFLDIDRDKAKNLNLNLNSVFNSISAYLGSSYVNDFNKFGRIYRVYIQADAVNRGDLADIERINVMNTDGKMVPLGAILNHEPTLGPKVVTRYNLYNSATINGFPNFYQGVSSGTAMTLVEDLCDNTLPSSYGYEWTGMSYQERNAGSSTAIYVLAFLFVFLVLAAQYESWTSPAAVVMSVPIALMGAVASLYVAKMSLSLYSQIGITLLIALASKNAILIVEFARDYRKEGKSIYDAAVIGGKVRFRPILMTSFSFILGTFPLVVATGAAAQSRISLGTIVFGGMCVATVIGTMFIPTFYYVMQRIQEGKKGREEEKSTVLTPPSEEEK